MNDTNNQSKFYISDEFYQAISLTLLSERHGYLYGSVRHDMPDSYSIKEEGWWIYTNEIMRDVYSSAEYYEKILEWLVADVNDDYAYFYFYILQNYNAFMRFCDEKLQQADFVDFNLIKNMEFSYRMSLSSLFLYPKYWQDDFKVNPINWQWSINSSDAIGTPVQVGSDGEHKAYFTQYFITELFATYCSNWQFSEPKSKKKVYVFTRAYSYSGDYEWCMIVQTPRLYKATFQVVLSKKNTKKIHSKDIVFQCKFHLMLEEFFDIGYMSSWKIQAIFRYHYVERYLEYIEPLIAERMG